MNAPFTPESFDPHAHPAQLNLGCGNERLAGFVNVDLHAWQQADLLADVRELGFLPEGHYELIYALDVLEHLPRREVPPALASWRRLLRDGGRLVVRVPNVLDIARDLQDERNQDVASQEALMRNLLGTQAYEGDFHLSAFTPFLLSHYLREAGFEVLACKARHGWMLEANCRKAEGEVSTVPPDYSSLLEEANPDAFVRRCFREILGRDADPEGLYFYRQNLEGGAFGRSTVIAMMLGSDEYLVVRGRTDPPA